VGGRLGLAAGGWLQRAAALGGCAAGWGAAPGPLGLLVVADCGMPLTGRSCLPPPGEERTKLIKERLKKYTQKVRGWGLGAGG
jgi:hypothetical protein